MVLTFSAGAIAKLASYCWRILSQNGPFSRSRPSAETNATLHAVNTRSEEPKKYEISACSDSVQFVICIWLNVDHFKSPQPPKKQNKKQSTLRHQSVN